jgi:hypothetical protein
MNYSLKSVKFTGSKAIELNFGGTDESVESIVFSVDVTKCKDINFVTGTAFDFRGMLKLGATPGWTLIENEA